MKAVSRVYLNRSLSGGLFVVILLLSYWIFNVNSSDMKIKKTYDFEPSIFTQGLELNEDELYFSSGLYGESFVGKFNVKTSEIEKRKNLSSEYFAEGLTMIADELWLLTWKENKGFVYDKNDFTLKRTFDYDGEGWGMASDQKVIYTSDGTNILSVRNITTFQVEKQLKVYDNGEPVLNLNELEFANGYLYANVWLTNEIYKINPRDGKVVKKYDLTSLVASVFEEGAVKHPDNVLNGIVHISDDLFYVTGKRWPSLFKIALK